MSGGRWDNREQAVMKTISEIALDIYEDMPKLSNKLLFLSYELDSLFRRLDYHYSGDTLIDNFKEFEKEVLRSQQESIKN